MSVFETFDDISSSGTPWHMLSTPPLLAGTVVREGWIGRAANACGSSGYSSIRGVTTLRDAVKLWTGESLITPGSDAHILHELSSLYPGTDTDMTDYRGSRQRSTYNDEHLTELRLAAFEGTTPPIRGSCHDSGRSASRHNRSGSESIART
nr:hypothetical protein CFP56_69037 [Quercus suber]